MRAEVDAVHVPVGAFSEWFVATEKILKACTNAREILLQKMQHIISAGREFCLHACRLG